MPCRRAPRCASRDGRLHAGSSGACASCKRRLPLRSDKDHRIPRPRRELAARVLERGLAAHELEAPGTQLRVRRAQASTRARTDCASARRAVAGPRRHPAHETSLPAIDRRHEICARKIQPLVLLHEALEERVVGVIPNPDNPGTVSLGTLTIGVPLLASGAGLSAVGVPLWITGAQSVPATQRRTAAQRSMPKRSSRGSRLGRIGRAHNPI